MLKKPQEQTFLYTAQVSDKQRYLYTKQDMTKKVVLQEFPEKYTHLKQSG